MGPPEGDKPIPLKQGSGEVRPSVRAVELVDVSKSFGQLTAVASVNLLIEKGELFTLLGPSGSGKTTVLRMIAGLIQPSSGQIWIGSEEVHSRPTYERNIGMVFQSLALFPHMDVRENIAFPLRLRQLGRAEIGRRVKAALDMVRLPTIEDRKTYELSGGQRQRVAIARALVYEPKLLLLDEPLGALDRRLREEMQLEIVRLHRDLDVTIINVTHDQREALMLSDRIGVMRMGHLEQVGVSEDIYKNPATTFVAEFLGDANLIEGRVVVVGSRQSLETETGTRIRIEDDRLQRDGRYSLVLRSESVRVGPVDPVDREEPLNSFVGRIAIRAFEGNSTYYEIEVPVLHTRVKASSPTAFVERVFEIEEEVTISWNSSEVRLIPEGSQEGA